MLLKHSYRSLSVVIKDVRPLLPDSSVSIAVNFNSLDFCKSSLGSEMVSLRAELRAL